MLAWAGTFLGGAPQKPMPRLSNPNGLVVNPYGVFILDGCTLHHYSHDQNVHKILSGEGEGPGQMRETPFYRPRLFETANGRLAVETGHKLIRYAPDGTFYDEIKKKDPMVLETLPMADGFVLKKIIRPPQGKEQLAIFLADKALRVVRELYRQDSPVQMGSTQMIPDSIYLAVFNTRVMIENSPQGYGFLVFDSAGAPLGPLALRSERIPVTRRDQKQIMEAYKASPLVKAIGFENLKQANRFVFPEVFPPITGMWSQKEVILVRTSFVGPQGRRYDLLTPRGKRQGHVDLPDGEEPPVIALYNGVDTPNISLFNQTVYALSVDEEGEWMLQGYPVTPGPDR